MQLENVTGAGPLVQAVDVLGDDRANQAQALKIRNRTVSVVGPGAGKPSPPHKAARPVTLPIHAEATNSPYVMGITRRLPSDPL